MRGADALVARRPAARPPAKRLANARIVAHRGIHDNNRIYENTLAAFDATLAAGIWGLECDVRLTRDREAVVFHDPDGRRLFGIEQPIEALTLRELRKVYPSIPTLMSVVERYGRKLHLMIEVKQAPSLTARDINTALDKALEPLVAGVDFHLMSLCLPLLAAIDVVPRQACLPIARLNVGAAFRAVADHGFGGLTGHYAVVTRRRVARLHRQGRDVGTGFINSRGCLFRELAREVDWLFSDRALPLQLLVSRHGGGV